MPARDRLRGRWPVCRPAAASGDAPKLRVAGNHLVDARSGQTFVPRGVNWPSFEYACSDGYGYSNSASAQNVGPDAAGAALIASWHINTVRLPAEPGLLARGGRAAEVREGVRLPRCGAQVGVERCTRRAWPWCSTCTGRGRRGVVSDGQRAMPDDRSDDFWSSVARTFKQDRSVIFDVFNEPYSRYGTNGAGLRPDLEVLAKRGLRRAADRRPPSPRRRDLHDRRDGGAGRRDPRDRRQAADHARRERLRERPARLAGQPAGRQASWSRASTTTATTPCHNQTCWDEVIAPIAPQAPVVTGEFGGDRLPDHARESFMEWADQPRRGLPDVGVVGAARTAACSTLAVLARRQGARRARRTGRR